MDVYLDTEFNGLQQNTKLISLALVCDAPHDGISCFYAEVHPTPKAANAWIQNNVISSLAFNGKSAGTQIVTPTVFTLKSTTHDIKASLTAWISGLSGLLKGEEKMTIWADVGDWDWVLFCELFGGAMNLPGFIDPARGEMSMLFRATGLDAFDTGRMSFSKYTGTGYPLALPASGIPMHNALWDAFVLRACHQILGKFTVLTTAKT